MRLGAQPFLWKSFIWMRMKKPFPYRRLSTYPRFETEARGNSEMVYCTMKHGTESGTYFDPVSYAIFDNSKWNWAIASPEHSHGAIRHNSDTVLRGTILKSVPIECFHSRGQRLCKFIGTKESVCIRKEFNSHRTGLGHQHGRRFIVLGHQYGHRDVMWKHSIRSQRP